VGEVHLHITVNTDIGNVPVAALLQHCDDVCAAATSPPDAVILLCTNLTLHGEAAALEQRTSATLLDSVYVTLWHTLQLLRADTRPLAARYGRLFALTLQPPPETRQ
jgi:maleate cis-trans isomerase